MQTFAEKWKQRHQQPSAMPLTPPGKATSRRTPPAAGIAANNGDRLLLVKLDADLHRLSLQPSREARTRLQAELLTSPTYADYLAKALAEQGLHGDDPVLVRCMIWAFNTRDMAHALRLAEFALQRGYAMPDEFKATVAVFVSREVAYWSLAEQKENRSPQPYLDQVWELSRQWDKPDQIEARLCKAKAHDIQSTDPAAALKLYRRADELDQAVGVTNAIKRLKKLLE